jgi:hypothetical protein
MYADQDILRKSSTDPADKQSSRLKAQSSKGSADYADPSSLWRASPRQVTQIFKLKAESYPQITQITPIKKK